MSLDPTRFPAALMATIGFDAVLRTEPAGFAEVRYVARADHAHSNGQVVQGGIITAWLDHAMAVAVAARDASAGIASLDIHVSFIDRVGQGPVIVAARAVKWGSRVAFLEAELADGERRSRILARASSTGMVLRSAG